MKLWNEIKTDRGTGEFHSVLFFRFGRTIVLWLLCVCACAHDAFVVKQHIHRPNRISVVRFIVINSFLCLILFHFFPFHGWLFWSPRLSTHNYASYRRKASDRIEKNWRKQNCWITLFKLSTAFRWMKSHDNTVWYFYRFRFSEARMKNGA